MEKHDAIAKMSYFAKKANPHITLKDIRSMSEDQIIEVNQKKVKMMADRRIKARAKVI